MEPPWARHVPTLTWTGGVDVEVVEVGFTSAVPSKAGEPAFVVRFRGPVLNRSLSFDEVRGGSDVGGVTPGNPVTPVHVPIGSVRAEFCVDNADEGFPVLFGVVPAVPEPCCGMTVAAGVDVDGAGVEEDPRVDVAEEGVEDAEAVPPADPVEPAAGGVAAPAGEVLVVDTR